MEFDTSGPARSIAAGDVDGDGNADVVVGIAELFNNDRIAVYLGRGDGTFDQTDEFSFRADPVDLELEDVNGDGRLDLLALSSGYLSVFRGDGKGAFVDEQRFWVGAGAQFELQDLDADGNLDAVVAVLGFRSEGDGHVVVLAGNPDGSFETGTQYDTGDMTDSLGIGDFNSDGLQDIVTSNRRSEDLSVLWGQSDGTFAPDVRLESGDNPVAVVTGDMNGDGTSDIAVVRKAESIFDPGVVSVFTSRGDGSFVAGVDYPVGADPMSLLTTDLNGDGHLDFVTPYRQRPPNGLAPGGLSIREGLGDGRFGDLNNINLPTGISTLLSVAEIDANNDGLLDIVTAHQARSKVSIVLQINDNEPTELKIELPQDVFDESAGKVTAHVTRVGASSERLNITLTASVPEQLILPPSIQLESGQTSAVFFIEIINDGDVDGDHSIIILAEAQELGDSVTMRIQDDDTQEQRTIGGLVDGTLVESEYEVLASLVVPADSSLKVEPGTQLRFRDGTGLRILGTLDARGETQKQIIFTSASETPVAGNWMGIEVPPAPNGLVQLSHVEIAYATTGLEIHPTNSTEQVTLRNSTIHHQSAHGVAISVSSGQHIRAERITIEDSEIHDNASSGVIVETANSTSCDGSSSRPIIRRNSIHHNGESGIVVESTTEVDSIQCVVTVLHPVLAPARTDLSIHDNVIHNNGNHGIHLEALAGACGQAVVSGNISRNEIYNNTLVGLQFFAAGGGGCLLGIPGTEPPVTRIALQQAQVTPLVEQNVVRGNGTGMHGMAIRLTEEFNEARLGTVVQNNLVVGNRDSGIVVSSFAVGDLTNVDIQIVNNTVIHNTGPGIQLQTATGPGFVIRNNIISNNERGIESQDVYVPRAESVGFNIVFGNHEGNWINFPPEYGVNATQNANGDQADAEFNLSVDPQLVSSTDPRLTVESPAIDAGSNRGAPDQDFEGQARDHQTDTVDIGFDEFRIPNDEPPIPGDANRDGVFNSSDLVAVFQVAEYEDGIEDNSTFEEGDWNGDGDFDSSDLVFAFQAGRYVAGVHLVPSSSTSLFTSETHREPNHRVLDAERVDAMFLHEAPFRFPFVEAAFDGPLMLLANPTLESARAAKM